jgi:class 3 adenylate cyclase/tetratricopeptide (TPR) repeat protein
VICAQCGTENLAGAKFCMECATPLASGCPNCGFVNLPNAKFCSECATPLSAGAVPGAGRAAPVPRAEEPVAERRVVSVLFADLVGFTPFAEERDAEDVRETLTRYFDLAREVIGRYGGTVEKFIGDAVMAVWGAPTAQEDDAERAVRAALDLVDRVRTLGPGIQARAGVLTGEAAVTVGATNQGMVAGDLVNTAARLQGVAEPGTVLVGESTQRAASNAIAFERQTDQALKGKQTPVAAWRAMRVVAERGGRNRSEVLEAPFVGRDDEIRLLKELFHATNREHRPRLVSVIGPGGIGKSRLAWEFLKYVDGLDETVWWHDGRSPSYGEGITFWALGEMVRERAGLREADNEEQTREKLSATIATHIADPDERQTVERALLALLGFESGIDSQQLFAAWRTFFERLADENPVVMVFEDLHFADSGLLDFIDHMLEWSRHSPITIVTLARPELLDKRSNWGAGKRSFSSIYLEPLTDEQMRDLLSGLVPGLPDKQVRAIVARADGIPLYAVETVRMLVADGRLTLQDGVYKTTGDMSDIAVPDTLTALIAARLDSLDRSDRALVADAAVLGQSFKAEALAALAGVDAAALEPRLAALVRRELIRREMDARSPELGQFVFVQALIREVAYNTLSKRDRKARHTAAARYLEGLGSDEVAGGLASHYLAAYRLAGEGPEADALATQARLALRGAAERAAALGSYDQAVALLNQAIGATPDTAERADLLERAITFAAETTDGDSKLNLAEQALAARRELGDRPRILTAMVNLGRAYAVALNDPVRAADLSLKAVEEFADLLETHEGVGLMVGLSAAFAGSGRMTDQLAWAERAIPLAEKFEMPDELAGAFTGRGVALTNLGRATEGMILLRGAHEFALANGLRRREVILRVMLTFDEQSAEPAVGLALAREGLERARTMGSTSYWHLMVGNGVICAFRVGEWDWAMALLAEAEATDPDAGTRYEYMIDRAILESLRGRDVERLIDESTALRRTVTDPQFESYEYWARAWAALSTGELAGAAKHATHASDVTLFFHPLTTPIAARALLWAGDVAGARAALDTLTKAMHRGQAVSLDKATIRAGIAALEGRPVDALAGYRDALRGWRALGLAWDEALAVIDMVTLLGPTDSDSRAAIDWARETLTRLGAKPYLDRLDAGPLAQTPAAPRTKPVRSTADVTIG